jgi:hypothetical protein
MKNTDKPGDSTAAEKESWSRFERAVDAAVKSGPIHKDAVKSKERPASKGRVQKGKTRD